MLLNLCPASDEDVLFVLPVAKGKVLWLENAEDKFLLR